MGTKNFVLFMLMSAYLFVSCRKQCPDNSIVDVNFYQQVSPASKEFKLGDTIRWHFYVPYNSIDNNTNETVDISKLKIIHQFPFSLVRIDSSEGFGLASRGLTHFNLSFLKGKNPTFFNDIARKDVRVHISLEKGNNQFEVIVQAIAIKRGVFMLSHGRTEGDHKCMLGNFVPKLFNPTRNEELFTQFAIHNTPVTFYGTEYFFRVK